MTRDEAHAFVREKTALGEIAEFREKFGAAYKPDAKPVIEAGFLRRLLLGLVPCKGDPDGPPPDRPEDAAPVRLPGVRITHARVEGVLDLSDCRGPGGEGLAALALEHCDLPDRLDLSGARLARFSIQDSRFRELWGVGVAIDGDFDFVRAKPLANSEDDETAYIEMRAARIGGDVGGRAAKLRTPQTIPEGMEQAPDALGLQSATIGGTLFLDYGFSAQGCIWLLGVKIGRDLQCDGARFANAGGVALQAARASIGGAVFLRAKDGERFEAEGAVSMLGASIGGALECDGARFANAGGVALAAQSARIGDSVLLRAGDGQRFEAEGAVSLLGASIGGNLELRSARLSHAQGWALIFETARIEGRLFAQNNTVTGAVSLAGARIGRLYDDPQTGWGDAGHTQLNELSYEHVGALPGARRPLWKARAQWLQRNTAPFGSSKTPRPFFNQPWRQAAAAFQRAGLYADARHIARIEAIEDNKQRPAWQRWPIRVLGGWPFGYGQSLWRTALTCLLVWLIGWGGTNAMLVRGVLVPADPEEREYSCTELITPPWFALDTMVPLIDLRQERECRIAEAADAALYSGIALPGPGRIALFEEVALWRWAKGLYAIIGAFVVGFALLIYTGVFRPKASE